MVPGLSRCDPRGVARNWRNTALADRMQEVLQRMPRDRDDSKGVSELARRIGGEAAVKKWKPLISRWATNKAGELRGATPASLRTVADAAGVNLCWLVYGEGQPDDANPWDIADPDLETAIAYHRDDLRGRAARVTWAREEARHGKRHPPKEWGRLMLEAPVEVGSEAAPVLAADIASRKVAATAKGKRAKEG